MAHKSKTQQARAAERKANRKDRQEREAVVESAAAEETVEEPKRKLKILGKASKPAEKGQAVAAAKKEEKQPKKTRFKFIKDVRAEMKRVTWPTKKDVKQWSFVVVGALVFFGVYVAILDNVIVTPALVALSGLGA